MTAPPVEEIADLLCAVLEQDTDFRATLGPDTRLDGDLFLDSIEVAALAAALRLRYGAGVDLAGYLARLDLDAIIALTLAEVARFAADQAGSR